MDKQDHLITERKYIDATPDDEYAIRILKAYRRDCDYVWSSSTDGVTYEPLIKALNDAQKKRAEVLDRAIELLTSNTIKVTYVGRAEPFICTEDE